ncbi:MAG: hypothetical protein LAQ69_01635 [Acidobacteriia bacterium]|nr:hypothetical protein [Terriglobia bacterium]
MPAIRVDSDPMVPVAGKLAGPNGPILKVYASSKSLHPPHELFMPHRFALDILEIDGNTSTWGCHED